MRNLVKQGENSHFPTVEQILEFGALAGSVCADANLTREELTWLLTTHRRTTQQLILDALHAQTKPRLVAVRHFTPGRCHSAAGISFGEVRKTLSMCKISIHVSTNYLESILGGASPSQHGVLNTVRLREGETEMEAKELLQIAQKRCYHPCNFAAGVHFLWEYRDKNTWKYNTGRLVLATAHDVDRFIVVKRKATLNNEFVLEYLEGKLTSEDWLLLTYRP